MKRILLFTLMAMLITGCKTDKSADNGQEQNTAIYTILTRVSVRHFTGEKISDEQVQTLLRCAMAAPSAVNKQPWAFVVVKDEALLQRIGETFPNSCCGRGESCAFVLCGDLQKAFEPVPDFWVNDVSAATENLLLAAHAMGLGAVWTGLHPNMERVKQAQELFQMPEHIVPLCIVPVGVPAEQPEVKDKWNESLIHYNVW